MKKISELIQGEHIELLRMLDAREHRMNIQTELLGQYKLPLISFTLNIAGPVKVFPLSELTYYEGVDLIQCQCKAWGIKIISKKEIKEATGYECFFVYDGDPLKVKKVLCELEETNSLGRLFDIDVLRVDGSKVSRTELGLKERKCLLCSNDAFVCSRSRTHSVNELIERTCHIMFDYFAMKYAKETASAAARALLYEVIATPKPGLVDKNNTGSHCDMDIFTFETSALALLPYFSEFIVYGIYHYEDEPEQLLPGLRPIGIQAEIAMLRATGGVNTHKGIIFSIGIFCAALGYLYGNDIKYTRDNLQSICRKISKDLKTELDQIDKKNPVTNGEKLFVKYGIKGARGEAADGFKTVFDIALKRMDQLIDQGFSLNDAGILTLISIIENSEDTNIISRSSYEEMQNIIEELKEIQKGGLENKDYLKIIKNLDQKFIAKNISPGGSADVLALTYFVLFYEKTRK